MDCEKSLRSFVERGAVRCFYMNGAVNTLVCWLLNRKKDGVSLGFCLFSADTVITLVFIGSIVMYFACRKAKKKREGFTGSLPVGGRLLAALPKKPIPMLAVLWPVFSAAILAVCGTAAALSGLM